MQTRKTYQATMLALLVLLRGAFSYANPVVDSLYGVMYSDNVWIFVVGSALGIEYLIVSHGLQRRGIKRRQILKQFLLINLLTVPITQMLGFCFSILAEVVPLTVEPILYRRFTENGGIATKSLTKLIVIANLISFGYGLIFYVMYPVLR